MSSDVTHWDGSVHLTESVSAQAWLPGGCNTFIQRLMYESFYWKRMPINLRFYRTKSYDVRFNRNTTETCLVDRIEFGFVCFEDIRLSKLLLLLFTWGRYIWTLDVHCPLDLVGVKLNLVLFNVVITEVCQNKLVVSSCAWIVGVWYRMSKSIMQLNKNNNRPNNSFI